MAIFKEKVKTIEAWQFNAAVPPYPYKIQVNALSSTGYSFDDLTEYVEPDDPMNIPAKKGFEIADTDWLIKDGNRYYKMSDNEFNNTWEPV